MCMYERVVPANTVESLVEYYGDDPLFLLKTFEKEEFAKQAEKGNFYANSVNYFRESGVKGQGDPNESVIQNLYYGSSNLDEKPTIERMKSLFDPKAVKLRDTQIKKYSLICFFGIFLEDCNIMRLDGDVDIRCIETKDYFKDFGRHVCVYEFSNVKEAVDEFKKTYKNFDFGKITYMPELEAIEIEDEKKKIDEIYINNLVKRYDKPYFFKDSIYSYQKEWRMVYPYKFDDDCKRNVKINLTGDRNYFEESEIRLVHDGKSMFIGFLPVTLVPNYKSPFSG